MYVKTLGVSMEPCFQRPSANVRADPERCRIQCADCCDRASLPGIAAAARRTAPQTVVTRSSTISGNNATMAFIFGTAPDPMATKETAKNKTFGNRRTAVAVLVGFILFCVCNTTFRDTVMLDDLSQGRIQPLQDKEEEEVPVDTHWCILDPLASSHTARRYFSHFPHAAENLLPCWSSFRHKHATSNCGFVLLGNFKLDYGTPPNPWQKQLVDSMGCQVIELGTNFTDRERRPLGPAPEPIQHRILPALKIPRYGTIRYFDDTHDAQALRRRVVSDEWISRTRDPETLYVGVLQRTSSRVFVDLDLLVFAIREALPDAVVNVTTLNTPSSLREQAKWFALQDVIFAAHGAALMNNCIFLRPKSVVMQFYTEGYFWQSLEPLVEQSGSVSLDWYPEKLTGEDPLIKMTQGDWRDRNAARSSNITVAVNGVIDVATTITPVVKVLYSLEKLERPT